MLVGLEHGIDLGNKVIVDPAQFRVQGIVRGVSTSAESATSISAAEIAATFATWTSWTTLAPKRGAHSLADVLHLLVRSIYGGL